MTTVTERPATITAKEFVEQGYAEKVKQGECSIVRPSLMKVPVVDVRQSIATAGEYVVDYFDGDWGLIEISDVLWVKWLPGAPVPATAGEEVRSRSTRDEAIYYRNAKIAFLESEYDHLSARIAALEAERDFADHDAKMYKEQYSQEHDNATMLYKALVKNTSPDIYKPIVEGLFQSTNEYDKLMSEGSRWKQEYLRETWKTEALEAERQQAGLLVTELTLALKTSFALVKSVDGQLGTMLFNIRQMTHIEPKQVTRLLETTQDNSGKAVIRLQNALAYEALAGDNGEAG